MYMYKRKGKERKGKLTSRFGLELWKESVPEEKEFMAFGTCQKAKEAKPKSNGGRWT